MIFEAFCKFPFGMLALTLGLVFIVLTLIQDLLTMHTNWKRDCVVTAVVEYKGFSISIQANNPEKFKKILDRCKKRIDVGDVHE